MTDYQKRVMIEKIIEEEFFKFQDSYSIKRAAKKILEALDKP